MKRFAHRRRWVRWFLWLILAAQLPASDHGLAPESPERVILGRWVEAAGGAQNLSQLKTVDIRSQIDFGAGAPPLEVELRATAGGCYRYDYELPRFGRLTQAFDGSRAWQRNDTLGFGSLTAAEHAQNLSGADLRVVRNTVGLPGWKLLPEVVMAGRQLQVLELRDERFGAARFFFDAKTGMRVRFESEGLQGGIEAVDYSDFRPVPGSGLVEAYRVVRTLNGRKVTVTVRDIVYNEPTDQELFTVPQAAEDDNREIERIMHDHHELMGWQALQRVQTRVMKELVEITTSSVKIPTIVSQKRPGLMVMEQDMPGMGKVWQGFDGHIGWAWNELQGYRVMQGAELIQLMAYADLNGPMQLGAAYPLRKLLEEKLEGNRYLVGIAIATSAGPGGNVYFDAKTFDLVRLETFVQTGPDGQMKVVADFSDFRQVDGVRLPFHTVLTNPAMTVVTTVQSVEQNVPLDDVIFLPKKE